MTMAEDVRQPIGTPRGATLVVVYALAMSVATWAFLNTGSQVLPGILVWIGWGLYPGLATFVAVRARSEMTVNAVTILTPALVVASFGQGNTNNFDRFLFPIAIAAGIFVGTWVASTLMRRSGRGRIVLGILLGGVIGGAVMIACAMPGLLLVSMGGPL